MADLNALFQNLGPTGGALMSGLTTGQDLVSAASQDAMREAQMKQILQSTAQAEQMNPLLLKAKQQEIDAAAVKAKQDAAAYRDSVLESAIPKLRATKGPQRMAEMEQIFKDAGLTLDDADRQIMYAKDPDQFLSELEAKHKFNIEESRAYKQAQMTAESSKESHLKGIEMQVEGQLAGKRMEISAKQDLANAKMKAAVKSIDDQAASGKLSYEKAAVAYLIKASSEPDPDLAVSYRQKAAQFEQLARNQAAASGVNKVDVGAATGLPTVSMPPVIAPVAPAAPPAAPPGPPSLPPGWTKR